MVDEFKVNMDASVNGTSLMGYFTASYAALKAAFGPPTEGDGYKVSTEWIFTDSQGKAYTLYDWKKTNRYDPSLPGVLVFRALPEYEWHVGAEGDITKFIAFLEERLGQRLGSVKLRSDRW